MSSGDVLHVVLDHRPAVPDIRRNAAELGHDVVNVVEDPVGVWSLDVEVDG